MSYFKIMDSPKVNIIWSHHSLRLLRIHDQSYCIYLLSRHMTQSEALCTKKHHVIGCSNQSINTLAKSHRSTCPQMLKSRRSM